MDCRMKNFRRVVLMALKDRSSIIAAICCSLIVAVLWGANFGVVKPLIEVVFSGRTPHEWIDWQLDRSSSEIARLEQELADTDQQLHAPQAQANLVLLNQRSRLQFQLSAEEKSLVATKWLEPYVKQYCPNNS